MCKFFLFHYALQEIIFEPKTSQTAILCGYEIINNLVPIAWYFLGIRKFSQTIECVDSPVRC